MLIGYVILGVAFILICQKTLGTKAEGAKGMDLAHFVLVLALSIAGLWIVQFSSYVALAGVSAVFVSFIKFVPKSTEQLLRYGGTIAFLGAMLVICAKQFLSPYSGQSRQEDRADWRKPTPDKRLSPREILVKQWSSSDQHADWPVAKLMLDMSRIAYQDPVDAGESLTHLGFRWESISDGSMNGYVAALDDTAVVVFRGTEDGVGDLLQDLQFFKRTNDHGRIHGGFDRGYLGLHVQVEKLLKRFKTKRVWLTGHSLGAALSIVCAYHLLQQPDVEIAGVMTFGQPMVVRQELADYLQSKLQDRYVFFVNDMDPIVKIVEPYVHFGHMVPDKDGVTFRVDPRPEDIRTSVLKATNDRIETGEPESMSGTSLDDLIHRIEDSNRPKYNENGELIVEGYLPDVYDHYLDSYDAMITRLVSGNSVSR